MFCSSQVCWDGGHFHFTILLRGSNNIQIYANVQKYPYYTALFRLRIFHDHPDDATICHSTWFSPRNAIGWRPKGCRTSGPKPRWHCYHVLVYISLGKNPTFWGWLAMCKPTMGYIVPRCSYVLLVVFVKFCHWYQPKKKEQKQDKLPVMLNHGRVHE